MMPPRKPLPPITKPHYWKAIRGEQTIYILGTVHFNFDIKELTHIIKTDFDKSDPVFIEAPFDIDNAKNLTLHYWQRLEDEKNRFKDLLTKKEFSAYKRIYEKSKFSKNFVKKDVPAEETNLLHAHTVLSHHMVNRLNNQDALKDYVVNKEYTKEEEEKAEFIYQTLRHDSTMDKQVQNMALDLSKSLLYLDSFELVLEMTKSLQKVNALSLLRASMEGEKSLETQHKQRLKTLYSTAMLINDYRNGKPFLITENKNVVKEGMDHLMIKQRNKYWAEKIEHVTPKFKRAFVAAGAAHMYGDKSFLYYLKKKGFEVKKYPF